MREEKAAVTRAGAARHADVAKVIINARVQSKAVAALAEHHFNAYMADEKRQIADAIKREMWRRPGDEPVIGRANSKHRMGRN